MKVYLLVTTGYDTGASVYADAPARREALEALAAPMLQQRVKVCGDEVKPVTAMTDDELCAVVHEWGSPVANISSVHLCEDEILPKGYADLSWNVEDVQTLRPSMTDHEATDFLRGSGGRHLRDRLCEAGWDVMETLLTMDGFPPEDGGPDEDGDE